MTETSNPASYDVIILGAGYGGLMAALGLAGRSALMRIALVNDSSTFSERIRLQETLSGPVADRLPCLDRFLAKTKIKFILARVTAIDPVKRTVRIERAGETSDLPFERCIYALGSCIDQTSVPGIAEHAYRLDPGEGNRSASALRAKLGASKGQGLHVAVVGGANTATEAAGEIKATWPEAHITMISRSRAGDFKKGARLETIARTELKRLGIRLIDGQAVTEVQAGGIVTAAGDVIPADICVWAAGVRAAPIAKEAGLAVDHQDRILVDPMLSSITHPHILAAGDAAHPIAPTGARYRMSAFAAITSGAYAAKRIIDETKGRRPRPFSFSAYGQGVAIGRSGVGFFTFPDDGTAYFVLRGPIALRIRNLFVWFLVFFLKLERRVPGSALFWIGRRRISWRKARAAIERAQTARKVQTA
jgi:NADH dehydrogenase FAD-containing subunit